MPGQSTTKADHDALNAIAREFAVQQDAVRQTTGRLKACVDQLRGGDWVGKAADTFYKEADSSLFPALQRMSAALGSAQRVVREISADVKNTESDIAALFGNDGVSGDGAASGGPTGAGSAGGDSGAQGGSSAGSPGEPGAGASPATGGASTTPEWQRDNPLLARHPNSLFTDQYFDEKVIGNIPRGADSKQLRDAMHQLWENRDNPNSPAVQQALKDIAEARGVPLEKIQADYAKYQQVRAQQQQAAAGGKGAVEGLDADHAGFMGSTSQLRFGQVVGDAFGIDPVFGSMLSPTGGLVGPGNDLIPGLVRAPDMGDSPLGYHGIVHDAAGYLKNYHNTGPGYDYLHREGRDTTNPLTGQQSGIRYWREKVPTDLASESAQWVADRAMPAYDKVMDIGRGVKDTYQGAKDFLSDGWDRITNW